ncbi:hypothetical protein [Priestia aryabhattai]
MGEGGIGKFQKEVIDKAKQEQIIETAEKMLKKNYVNQEIIDLLNISHRELKEVKRKLQQ